MLWGIFGRPKARSAEEWIARGLDMAGRGLWARALRCFERAAEAEPGEPRALAYKAIRLWKVGPSEAAVEAWDAVLALDDQCVDAWCGKAFALTDLRFFDEAVECCERAERIHPGHAKVLTARADILATRGRLAEALPLCEQAIAADEDEAEAWYQKGRVLCDLGRREEAVPCLERAILSGVHPRALATVADAQARRGLAGVIKRMADAACRVAPWDGEVHYRAASARWASGEPARYVYGRLTEAIVLNPRHTHARCLWATVVLRAGGSPSDALRLVDIALEIDPELTWAWNLRAEALLKLRRWEEAVRALDRVLAEWSESFAAWYGRAVALEEMGQLEEALASVSRAAELDPDAPAAWRKKADILERLGKTEEAQAARERAGNASEYQMARLAQDALRILRERKQ